MLFKTSKPRLLQHITAILAVSFISACLYIFISGHQLKPPFDGKFFANLGKGKEATKIMVELNSALSHGQSLVVLGSSELGSNDLSFIPYNFLPKILNTPVLAYGHAYFQSFAMYGLLAANANALSSRTKIVIMVSPGWFKESSLQLDAFIEHFQPQVLTNLYQDPEARTLVEQYVKLHLNGFDKLSRYQDVFAINTADFESSNSADQFMWRAAVKDKIFSTKTRVQALLTEPDWLWHSRQVPTPVFPSAEQWKKYENQAYETETSHMRNNQRWVRDDYFEKYLKDIPAEGAPYFPAELDINPEFSMLTVLLKFLQSKNVQALVVMQPLNPFVYKDAAQANPIAKKIETLCQVTDMQYFDMTATKYEPGILRDGMHLGEIGWAQVDKKIMEYIASR